MSSSRQRRYWLTGEELPKVACENLSAAASEVSSERRGLRLTFTADATQGAQHHLRAGLRIEGPFTSTRLVFRFPRWVPGSYFLREPIQHMFNFSAMDQEGRELTWKRVGVDGVSVALRKGSSEVSISYTLLAKELSVRSNHLDTTHLHLMPPFTWFWPERGIDPERLNLLHSVELLARAHGRQPHN